MFKYWYIGLVSFLLLSASACKKDVLHWQKMQPVNSGTTSRLNHIRFLDDTVCLVGGGLQFDKAEILRSVDGGYIWTNYSYPQSGKGIYGMTITSRGDIFTSGTDGTILHSVDRGQNFSFGRIGTWAFYVGASFPTPDTGIFVSTILERGCTITRIDSSFNILDSKDYLFGANDIYMVSGTVGYMVGYGAVLKTTDRGDNWSFLEPHDDNFTAMDIHGDEIWMCGANGGIYHTLDAGSNWQRYRNGNDITLPHYGLRCIVFKDEFNGWAAGDDGILIHTDDGGRHWAQYDRFTSWTIRSIALCPNSDLLVVGDNGTMFRLTTR